MEEKVVVVDGIHASMAEEQIDVFMQFLADPERVM